MSYKQKLLDPRWQKCRLEILQRDDFRCTVCQDSKSTLHVHHLEYTGSNPWETDPKYLITLCDACHGSEHKERPENERTLLDAIRKKRFPSYSLVAIEAGFEALEEFHEPAVMASVIEWTFSKPEIMRDLCKMFFEDIISNSKDVDGLPFPSDDTF